MAPQQPKPATSLLTKRGTPLGNAWLAAHLEKKLHKGAIIKTDVHGTVAEVIETENGQLALRISGHLLLGIVRIFSRQVDYLLDDVTDAVVKVRLAFNPAALDLPPEAQPSKRFDELTLPANQTAATALDIDLDGYTTAPYETLELPNLAATAGRPTPGSRAGRARDHTLAEAEEELGGAGGGEDPFAMGGEGAGYEGLGFGPSDDFELFDRANGRQAAAGADTTALRAATPGARGSGRRGAGGEEEEEEETLRRDASARRSLGGGLGLSDDVELQLPGGGGDGEVELGRGASSGRLRLSQLGAELSLPPGLEEEAGGEYGAQLGGGYDGYDGMGDAELLPPGGADGEGGEGGAEGRGLEGATLDLPLDAAMVGADGTPSLLLRNVLLAAAGNDGTPSVSAFGQRARARGARRGAGAAGARSCQLLLDSQTQISGAAMKAAMADVAPTLRAPPAEHGAGYTSPAPGGAREMTAQQRRAAASPAAQQQQQQQQQQAANEEHVAAALAARAKAISAMDAASFFAAPVIAGDPADLSRAYAARPYHAPHTPASEAAAAGLSAGGKRRRGAAAAAEDAAAAAAAAARLDEAAREADADGMGVAGAGAGEGDEQGPYPMVVAGEGEGEGAAGAGEGGLGIGYGGGEEEEQMFDQPHDDFQPQADGEEPPLPGEQGEASPAPAKRGGAAAAVPAYNTSLPTVDGAETGAASAQPGGAEQRVGWSMRTQKMFAVLRATFDESGQDVLSYQAMAASTKQGPSRRRVVAGCFQELLFLASHGLVSLSQDEPYADIAVSKTNRFDTTVADSPAR